MAQLMGRRRVLLVGDSVCISPGYVFGSSGYAPVVAERLRPAGIDVGWWPRSGSTLLLLESLSSGEMPLEVDLIHFNAGLHDVAIRRTTDGCPVDLPTYTGNLHAIIDGFRRRTAAQLVWASTTPVLEERQRQLKPSLRRVEDIRRYNRAAAAVMAQLGVPIHDLHAILAGTVLEDALGPDGVHPSEHGRAMLVDAVATLCMTSLHQREQR